MWQYKFNYLFIWGGKRQKTHLSTPDSSEYNPCQNTAATVRFQQIPCYQILCGLLKKQDNHVNGTQQHVSLCAVSSCVSVCTCANTCTPVIIDSAIKTWMTPETPHLFQFPIPRVNQAKEIKPLWKTASLFFRRHVGRNLFILPYK